MSGIARLLLERGYSVSGSDIKENAAIRELRALGAAVYIGHEESNADGADMVIYSSAIKDENPEVRRARIKGIPLIMRAQALAELMRDKTVITVAGSHGKTTTSSMVSHLFMKAGLAPTVAVGGILRNTGTNASSGSGSLFVAEADESDGSFLWYAPKYSIITNIDREHLDHYGSFESEIDAFRLFIERTSPEGCLFCCADDARLCSLASASGRRTVTFGLNGGDITATDITFEGLSSRFNCYRFGNLVSKFALSLGGRHNVSNSLAVIALALELGIPNEVIADALSTYTGARRRLDTKMRGTFTVIDDYAHHPSEIQATLEALGHLRAPGQRMVVVFQPHRYTRLNLLLREFTECFGRADSVVFTDVYAAGEKPIDGVTGRALFEKFLERNPGRAACFCPRDALTDGLLDGVREGDMIVTLGAGDITAVSDELAEKLAHSRQAA